jgi:signal transduction histidine kinase
MHVKVKGKTCHVNYCPVEGTDWSLAMVCPDSEILSGYQRLGFVIVLILFFGFIMMWWLCQRSVRQTIRPLKKLLGYTERITSGDYSETIPHSEQRDDVGRLQNGFADMQDALRENMGRISKAADTIKKQNEERSKEMKLAEEVVQQKTAFIQNVSHQIRTPLNIISGFSNMLYEDIVHRHENGEVGKDIKEDNKLEIADTMKYNAFHLKRMIIMLYDSSSLKGDDKLLNAAQNGEEVSCNEIANEAIVYIKLNYPGLQVNLQTNVDDDFCIVTNHLYLMRTLRELLYNSAKYSDGQHILLSIKRTESTIQFIVEDTGKGIAESDRDLIFKSFTKVDDLSEGLGLGLPLAKRHACTLGGDLILDDSYHDGCRFILEFPLEIPLS